MSEPPRWLRAGVVGRPHGLDGSFHVVAPTAGLLAEGAHVVVEGRERTIERCAGTETRVIVRLDGCSDRAAAEQLRGRDLLVARAQVPELEADEWWAADLEGCTVYDGLRAVGTVMRLLALPSCEVLEVQREHGQLLVPLVSDAVRAVDVDERRIDIDLRFLGEA